MSYGEPRAGVIHDRPGHATSSVSPALIVIAKAPVPGRVKTRLTPPCTPEQAAALAEAALQDTLAAARAATRAGRRVLVLDGEPGAWAEGFEVLPQRGAGLEERLAAAFADVGEAAFLVGMDTPQLTPELLDLGLGALADGAPASFGAALDGGYWGIGLRAPDPAVFAGVPMSTDDTGAVQLTRLRELGLDPVHLPPLLDVDTIADARLVAAEAPRSRFAAELAAQAPGEVAA
jgi:uncharacterized protein